MILPGSGLEARDGECLISATATESEVGPAVYQIRQPIRMNPGCSKSFTYNYQTGLMVQEPCSN